MSESKFEFSGFKRRTKGINRADKERMHNYPSNTITAKERDKIGSNDILLGKSLNPQSAQKIQKQPSK